MEAQANTSTERARWLDEEQHFLVQRLELSAAYHSKRERFLLTCERLSQGIAAVAATAAFTQFFNPQNANTPYFSMFAAVASITPLVFGWASRANKHAVLAGDHRRLLSRVIGTSFDLSEEQLVVFRGDLAAIEANEGASLGALVVQCQNELASASNHPEFVVPLKWYQRALMHILDFDIRPPGGPGGASSKATALNPTPEAR